jgi:hypothetical protein
VLRYRLGIVGGLIKEIGPVDSGNPSLDRLGRGRRIIVGDDIRGILSGIDLIIHLGRRAVVIKTIWPCS